MCVTHVHPYSVTQSDFTALKSLCAPPGHPPLLTPTATDCHCPRSVAVPGPDSGNHTACRLSGQLLSLSGGQ